MSGENPSSKPSLEEQPLAGVRGHSRTPNQIQKEELCPFLVILKDCEPWSPQSSHRKLRTSCSIRTLNLDFIKILKAPETKTSWTKSLGTSVSGTCLFCLVSYSEGNVARRHACNQVGLWSSCCGTFFTCPVSSKVRSSSSAKQMLK